MRVKLTNMLSVFADSLGQQASRFEPVVGHGCSPRANLIFPACLGKCLVSNMSSLCKSCEAFKYSKSFAARARLLQIQMGADCLCRSRALATKAVQFRLVRLGHLAFKQSAALPPPLCLLQQSLARKVACGVGPVQVRMKRLAATPRDDIDHLLSTPTNSRKRHDRCQGQATSK